MSPPTTSALTFHGGAGSVTGSKFLIETPRARVLVEAGLYQGLAQLRRRNWSASDFEPSTIDAIVLTHAHLDHCGYVPRLVRDGFTGPIHCTPETASLAAIVLRDSAHLQEEDARQANEGGWSKHRPALPLYDGEDVERALAQFESTDYGKVAAVAQGLDLELEPAGHILGSAIATIDLGDTAVTFSGDLGRPGHPLLTDAAPPGPADTIVIESTYGDRAHPPSGAHALAEVVRRTAERGGTVLIPAFAVDRTELVVLSLAELTSSGEIPRLPVYVDSPMALATLEVYRHALAERRPGTRQGIDQLTAAFRTLDLRPVHDAGDSQQLNNPSYPCIVISASGMATGGRVVHHLAHQLPSPRNSVVLTGYQAVGTRGRLLAEGARQVKIHGRYVPVHADVVALETMTVHADADDLIAWLQRAPRAPRTVYVVHGEPRSSDALASRIRDELGWTAVPPRLGERVRLR
ncbi:MAG TPA: MBL fold metallo-hydrolase [Nocardioides sp.]|uniref:MBL fold metallo-hydrolase n=1 Tax=Nocardioides sp. TaxID=35761 RepID=UPI002CCD95EE|nr:MBL fold metallo-hydrolase [Nocardioides sp.]HTW13854.1 MBL fold metallo-hydrolase [Nocardioides sp.]